MRRRIYRFRNFRLDPQGRELSRDGQGIVLPASSIDCLIYLIENRERSVGRDELAAAVWGRVNVSEVSVNHAIMRLRRALGDTGNEQTFIRTLPRVGYRWIGESIAQDLIVDQDAAADPLQAPVEHPVEHRPIPVDVVGHRLATPSRKLPYVRAAAMLAALGLAVGLAGSLWWHRAGRVVDPQEAMVMRSATAVVLPARIDASDEWTWLGLGLMDLIANQLRRSNVPTLPSETVVGLVRTNNGSSTGDLAGVLDRSVRGAAILRIDPYAEQAAGVWTVRLDVKVAGQAWHVESESSDVLAAARDAADQMMFKLGRTPAGRSGTSTTQALDQLQQQINAAMLASQLALARSLVDSAPPDLRSRPEIAFAEASIEFFAGRYDATQHHLEVLLDRLPPTASPRLRAQALNRLAASHARRNQLDDADAASAKAIAFLAAHDEPDLLARAHVGRGAVALRRWKLDEATAHFGQARMLYDASHDLSGEADVDLSLGSTAMARGQPGVALPLVRRAAERFEALAMSDARIIALRNVADAHTLLLEHHEALATTDRFWPVETHSGNQSERWWTMLSRARALVGVGRLADADALLRQVSEHSDPQRDGVARAVSAAQAAQLSLLKGDTDMALAHARAALTPVLEERDDFIYATTWRTRIIALHQAGEVAGAAREVVALTAWAATRQANDRRQLYVAMTQAEQAEIEGHGDQALRRYGQAMAQAQRIGVPEDIVAIGQLYVRTLLAAGLLDQASSVSGQLASWAHQDARAAWTQASVYAAAGNDDAARKALDRAQHIAGERPLRDPAIQRP